MDVNVVDEARIVRDHVGEVSRLLQGADNGVVRAFKDANDAPGGKIAATATAGIFRIPRDARDYAITVHGGAGVFGGNENVALLSTFARKETETGLVDLDSTGHEVGGSLGLAVLTTIAAGTLGHAHGAAAIPAIADGISNAFLAAAIIAATASFAALAILPSAKSFLPRLELAPPVTIH